MKLNLKLLVIFLVLALQATSRRHKLLRRGKGKGDKVKRVLIKSYEKKGVKLGKKLGKGAFGTVYEGEDEFSGNKSALKTMLLSGDEELLDAKREISVMTKVKRLPAMLPICGYNIIRLKKGKRIVSLQLPKATGSLHDLLIEKLDNKQTFHTVAKYDMFVQMAIGLDALHNKRFVHRDIKPDNFLIMEDNDLVYADFGITVPKKRKFRGIAGTPGFIPYDYDSDGDYMFGPSVDVYALGLTMACIDYPELYFALRKSHSHGHRDDLWDFAAELRNLHDDPSEYIEAIAKIIEERTQNRDNIDQALFDLIYDKIFVPLGNRISSAKLLQRLRNLDPDRFDEINDRLKKKNYCSAGQDWTEFDDAIDEGNTHKNQIFDFGANANQLSKINPNHFVEREFSIEEEDVAETARMLEDSGIHEQFEDFDSADEEVMNENTSANNHMGKLGGIKVNPSKMLK